MVGELLTVATGFSPDGVDDPPGTYLRVATRLPDRAPTIGYVLPMGSPLARQGLRFRTQFPALSPLLASPATILAVFVVASASALAISLHLSVAVLIVGGAFAAVSHERRFLDRLIVTPTAQFLRPSIFGGAIGATCIAGGSGWREDPWLLSVQIQCLYSLVCTAIAMIFALRNIPGLVIPEASGAFRTSCLRPLALIGWVLLGLQSAGLLAGAASGAFDRTSHALDSAVASSAFGYWSAFALLPRFSDVGLMLAPVMWAVSGWLGRVVLASVCIALVLMGMALGTRGMVISPFVAVLLGTYLFSNLPPGRSQSVAIVTVLVAMVVTPVVDVFRNTPEFASVPAWDLLGRLSQLPAALDPRVWSAEPWTGEFLAQYGQHLVGVRDALVYELTPSSIPHAGADRLGDAVYAWIPQALMQSRESLMDGNDIASTYMGYSIDRTYNTISFEADLYRRWGVTGILVGTPIAAVGNALLVRAILVVLQRADAVLGFLLLCGLMQTYRLGTWSTVLFSAQVWTWDLPKHLAAAMILCIAARRLSGAGQGVGLRALGAARPGRRESGESRPQQVFLREPQDSGGIVHR
jgi:hypothetical protein